MAHIYIGDHSRVDTEVLEAVKHLPDDFWVFAEFDVGRNIDWFVVRPFPNGPATVILMELKRHGRRLEGDTNGPWREEVGPDEWRPLEPAGGTDVNPYWQAVNTANEMKAWLWNHHRRYRDDPQALRESEVKVWPDVVILSPAGVNHLLPIKPASNYGSWFYSTKDWTDHLLSWRPAVGMPFAEGEVRRLAAALGVAPVGESEPKDVPPVPEVPPSELWRRLQALEGRVAELERQTVVGEGLSGRAEGQEARRGEITDQLREALESAVTLVRRTGRSRATPSILSAMKTSLGYDLKETNYNGLGTATAFFEQARRQGIIKFGPYLGPNPTIFLPDEETDEQIVSAV